MDEKQNGLYTTGEISKICKVTKRAIRHYEQLGMIKPYLIDEKNSYRYYDPSVLKVIQQIRYFLETGSSIEEIKALMVDMDMEKLKNHLLKKVLELESLIKVESKKYEALKAWYGQCVKGKNCRLNNYENNIGVEYLPRHYYIFCDCKGDSITYIDKVNAEARLFASFNQDGHTMCESIGELNYIFDSAVDRAENGESRLIVAQAIRETLEGYSNIIMYGGTLAIYGYHVGKYDNIGETYQKLFQWGNEHSFQLRGDAMEKQLVEHYMTFNESEFVTKIYLPVSNDASDEELEYNLNCR